MLAERLARLLGSIVALAMLMGGVLLLNEPPIITTTGYDWTADIADVGIDYVINEGPASGASQVAHASTHGAF